MKRSTRIVLSMIAVAVTGFAQIPSLADLIQQGNRKAALEKIRAGADVNAAQPDGTTPLHWAVYRVDYELVQALLAQKAKVNVSNEFGSAPLAEAVKLSDSRMVQMLMDAGAKADAANLDGETALMLAIKSGDLLIVQTLINAGANVNAVEKFHDQTPLMYAAAANKNASEMVKLLIAKGANVKPRARSIDWPNQVSSEPRAQYRPTGGLTALLYAARNGCYACVEALIAAGADVNVPTPEGVTPLMIAIDNGYNEVAKLLLDHGANPHVWDWWGRTALYIAIDRKEATGRGGPGRGGAPPSNLTRTDNPAPVSHMDLVSVLLNAGVNPNAEMNMHRPSRGGNSGRFGDNQLSTGTTPLFRAVQGNDLQVIQALLAKGANPNINTMGYSAWLLAAGAGPNGRGGGAANQAILDLMIQHNADVNAKVTGTRKYTGDVSYDRANAGLASKEGTSPLHEAARSGQVAMVKYLLDHGANPNILDFDGKKPIDVIGKPHETPGAAAPAANNAKGKGAPDGANQAALAEIRTLLQNAVLTK